MMVMVFYSMFCSSNLTGPRPGAGARQTTETVSFPLSYSTVKYYWAPFQREQKSSLL